MQIVYLISQYPALSHTFILREIQKLEALGCVIHIASINTADRSIEAMSPEEAEHARRVFYIKRAGILGALTALAQECRTNLRGLLRGLREALWLGGLHPKELLMYLFYFTEAVILAHWARRQGVHHVHVHFGGPVASVGVLCRVIMGGMFSLTVHGPDELSDVSRHRLGRKFAIADRVVCISDYARSRVMLHADCADWEKTRVVRVGLPCAPFLRLGASRSIRRTGDRPVRLLSIGRLSAAKGHMILLEAFAQLREHQCPVHLTLIGSGPLEGMIRTEARRLGLLPEVLTLTGGLNQEAVREHLREADVFVMASFAEGLPVVLMEALLSGLPCVTTSIAGIPELIRHEKDGLLVPAGNAEALAGAIRRLAMDPALARKLAESGRERVLTMHDIHRTGTTLHACFSELHQEIALTRPAERLSETCVTESETRCEQRRRSPR